MRADTACGRLCAERVAALLARTGSDSAYWLTDACPCARVRSVLRAAGMFFGFNAFDPRHSPAVSAKQESYASSFTASALGCVRITCDCPQRSSTCARCAGVFSEALESPGAAVLRAAAPQSVGGWERGQSGTGHWMVQATARVADSSGSVGAGSRKTSTRVRASTSLTRWRSLTSPSSKQRGKRLLLLHAAVEASGKEME
jgi:hypothetical protein